MQLEQRRDLRQTITVYARFAGQSSFKPVATLTTGPNGVFNTTPASITSDVAYYVRVGGIRSGTKQIRFAPLVTFTGPTEATALQTGPANKVTFTGTVSPSDVGAEVVLQREGSTSFEEWIPIQRGIVGTGSSYTIVHKFTVPGEANLRVIVRPHGKFDVRGISNTLSYGISQPQNPALTINSSADPVPYGQPVTLSGVVAGTVPLAKPSRCPRTRVAFRRSRRPARPRPTPAANTNSRSRRRPPTRSTAQPAAPSTRRSCSRA